MPCSLEPVDRLHDTAKVFAMYLLCKPLCKYNTGCGLEIDYLELSGWANSIK